MTRQKNKQVRAYFNFVIPLPGNQFVMVKIGVELYPLPYDLMTRFV
jgi:hypothetical protein